MPALAAGCHEKYTRPSSGVLSMAITEKTRKILWGRSGNRCAICHRELVMDARGLDNESIIGDECHIVAREANGPRGSSLLPAEERDAYDNLILLCRVHHKIIDDQPDAYGIQVLKNIKQMHEAWVRESLNSQQLREPTGEPFIAGRIRTGKQLFSIIAGSLAHYFDNDQPESESEANLIGDFAQNIQDYIDVWDDMESRDRITAQFEMDKNIQELESSGFLVYGCQRKDKIRILGQVDTCLVTYLIVLRKTNPLVKRKDGGLESKVQQAGRVQDEFTNFIFVGRRP